MKSTTTNTPPPMTPDQLKNIKYGRSLLTGTISPQDIERRQQWIDRHLADVLDLAIKQQTRILEFQSAMESNAYEMEQAKIRHAEDIKLLNDRLTERREAYEEHIAKRKLLEPLVELVKEWGREKGITGPNGKGTLMAQAAKMMEEAQEAFDGAQILCSDGTKHEITDGIGEK